MSKFISIPGDPLLNLIHRTVHRVIKNHKTLPSEAKHALKGSGHVKTLISNLHFQYRQAQDVQIKRRGKKISDKTIEWGIESFVENFIKGFEGHIERRRESEIAKYQREHAQDEQSEMQQTLEGKSTGAFEDMGLVIPEDQQEFTENHIKEPSKHDTVIDYGRAKSTRDRRGDTGKTQGGSANKIQSGDS